MVIPLSAPTPSSELSVGVCEDTPTPSLDRSQTEGTRIHAGVHLPLTGKSEAQAQGRGEGSHALLQVSFAAQVRERRGRGEG